VIYFHKVVQTNLRQNRLWCLWLALLWRSFAGARRRKYAEYVFWTFICRVTGAVDSGH